MFYCLTNFLPDWCNPGPAIPVVASHESGDYRTVSPTSFWTGAIPDRQSPRWFPTSSGINGRRISLFPAGRCALTGHSRNADIAHTGSHRHPPESPDYVPHPPAGYSQSALSAHSLTITCSQYVRAFTVLLLYTSGLSPYCCSRCTGFHRTAVQLLAELCTHRYPHRSSQHLYIDSHNTLYLLTKSPMCLSQNRSNN